MQVEHAADPSPSLDALGLEDLEFELAAIRPPGVPEPVPETPQPKDKAARPPAAAPDGLCYICGRPAPRRAHYCWTHARRLREGRPNAPLRAVNQSPLQRVWEAIHVYMEADSEDDAAFTRARWRLLAALKAYRRAPPAKGGRQGQAYNTA